MGSQGENEPLQAMGEAGAGKPAGSSLSAALTAAGVSRADDNTFLLVDSCAFRMQIDGDMRQPPIVERSAR